mmetsp:Transcript_16772/g.31781  ORF Transcript_16772/g.31781 Transcript_16772/m.31781 type:complete len:521 (+) Transcript_16772:89-1651(+)|eukprot:CAMPEP_0176490720 /NCGR_PEP_ID=MMETSP0200_2-20121128/8026_1 /TAXON_ID=947934 /ORGANISM="Chaetoceros sp., Strain GSL56" /LENGTH=520 /DNA_ID=CAMNT_0017888055 /DNA_START=30 /DNA_END=1592 /DNA_ORIENTATION=-
MNGNVCNPNNVHEDETKEIMMTSSSLSFVPTNNNLGSKNNNDNDNNNDNNISDYWRPTSYPTNYTNVQKNATEECSSFNENVANDAGVVVSSEACSYCKNNDMKTKSWSMLELNEMKAIHGLQDDMMEGILSLDSNEFAEEGDEDEYEEDDNFLFIDCDVDETDRNKQTDIGSSSSYDTNTNEWHVTNPCVNIQRNKKDKRKRGRKFQSGILQNLGLKRSMSMGILPKHYSSTRNQSHRMKDVEEPEHSSISRNDDGTNDAVSSLDVSHHDYSNRHGINLGRILQDDGCRFTESPLSVTEYCKGQDIATSAIEVAAPAAAVTTTVTAAKRTLSLNRMNRICPSTRSSSSASYCYRSPSQHPSPAKMPQSSILKKSTSMVHLQCGDNPTNTSCNTGKMKRVTSFSTLEIREYNVTIGDNPGGKQGPPLSLDWDYCQDRTIRIDIDRYEQMRAPRRKKHEMYMPGSIRMWTLMKYLGFSLREIEDASKAADVIRKKREKSIKYQNYYDLQYRVGKILKIGRG